MYLIGNNESPMYSERYRCVAKLKHFQVFQVPNQIPYLSLIENL